MTTYDLGDGVPLEHLVYDRDDELADATVVLTVTRPDGTTITPTLTHPSAGVYRAAVFTADQLGLWSGAWVTSGGVISVAPFAFQVADPAPQPYASLATVKKYLGIDPSDTRDDDGITDALASVTTEIDDVCERTFSASLTATTRTFTPISSGLVLLDDFYTLTDLAIAVDGAAWSTPFYYQLKPANGLVRGRPWPYERLEALNGNRLPLGWESVSVTARWGWASVPEPVREACKIATSETFALKDARFGVAGWGQMGDIRVRDNPMVMKKLKPYMRSPVKVA